MKQPAIIVLLGTVQGILLTLAGLYFYYQTK